MYGWVSAMVRECVGGIGELRDDELSTWFVADVRGSLLLIFSYLARGPL